MLWWSNLIFIVIGWSLKAFYDWKIHPAITKSQRKSEKKEAEKEERGKKGYKKDKAGTPGIENGKR